GPANTALVPNAQLGLDPLAMLPQYPSMNFLATPEQVFFPSFTASPPATTPPPPSEPSNDSSPPLNDRQVLGRQSHRAAEKQRRESLKSGFDKMKELLPGSILNDQRNWSQTRLLDSGLDYIQHLQEEKRVRDREIRRLNEVVRRLSRATAAKEAAAAAGGAGGGATGRVEAPPSSNV
ncbi:hypothetical protein HDU98_004956, partial [Podochytrium sp. JEL0797]